MPLNARSMGSARQTGHTPHSRTSRSFIQKARRHYCFISPIQHIMHYFTQNMPTTPLQQETPILGCLLMEIHGFCPPNRTYPPWPHLRYPLTSKDEDPNKKILARQSCSRAQRTILFYLTHTGYHALLHTKHTAKPYNRRHPLQGAFWARSMGLARQPGIPPTAAPPLPPHLKG